MFIDFFYYLRKNGLDVSPSEWMTLQKALDLGLADNSVTQFYHLCRMILLKSEAEYDKFDMCFQEFFHALSRPNSGITKQMMEWLEDYEEVGEREFDPDLLRDDQLDMDEVQRDMQKRIEQQTEEHNGGNYWIGRHGNTPFGNSGQQMGGIRIGGHSEMRSAFQIASERKFRDFRQDRVFDIRQFQVALKRLRQFSSKIELPRTELDLDGTIQDTCNNGGFLKLRMEKPKKNTVKLLMLMDSGGSMKRYANLCTALFKAVNENRFFKDVKIYYFHNCIYGKVFNTPECTYGDWVDTEWLIKNVESDYKVIIVGDAMMAPEELYHPYGSNYLDINCGCSSMQWFERIKARYPKIAWLNPSMHTDTSHSYFLQTEKALKQVFPMYFLSVNGMTEAMRMLISSR
ncbi:MAG: VWA domain-containing protein [Christensenellaceae bacterium]|nr:VWA domain-containing protein [Christensenellaceae bacterium]